MSWNLQPSGWVVSPQRRRCLSPQCRPMIRCFYTAPLLELQSKRPERLGMHCFNSCVTFTLVYLQHIGCYSNDVGVSRMSNDFLLQRLRESQAVSVEREKGKMYILLTHPYFKYFCPPLSRVKCATF